MGIVYVKCGKKFLHLYFIIFWKLVRWQVIRVLLFSKLTEVNEELCVNLKFLWSRGKSSTRWTFGVQAHWSWKSETFIMRWTDRQKASGKRDRHGTALLETLLSVQPESISIDSAGAHRLLTELLGLWSWALLYGLSASVWLWSLTGVCKGKAEGTPPRGDISEGAPQCREP